MPVSIAEQLGQGDINTNARQTQKAILQPKPKDPVEFATSLVQALPVASVRQATKRVMRNLRNTFFFLSEIYYFFYFLVSKPALKQNQPTVRIIFVMLPVNNS